MFKKLFCGITYLSYIIINFGMTVLIWPWRFRSAILLHSWDFDVGWSEFFTWNAVFSLLHSWNRNICMIYVNLTMGRNHESFELKDVQYDKFYRVKPLTACTDAILWYFDVSSIVIGLEFHRKWVATNQRHCTIAGNNYRYICFYCLNCTLTTKNICTIFDVFVFAFMIYTKTRSKITSDNMCIWYQNGVKI